jgi:putative protein-disulfide isomerase
MTENVEGHVIFMTDPICSWCWGMLPELFILQEEFGHRLNFDLRCAGLQLGSKRPLREDQAKDLIALWHRVAETTGQQFAFSLPADATFIYHSELACRALHIARRYLQEEPWQLFQSIQEAFYVHCRNINDLGQLFKLVKDCGIDEQTFRNEMTSETIIASTRNEFDWCNSQGIQALPTLFLDLGTGPKLISGGFATAEYLVPEIKSRLVTH